MPSLADYAARLPADAAARADQGPGRLLVLHPGPMNRGVEIASEVADGPRSLILKQVANGVFVRMAVAGAVRPRRRVAERC